jgi:hypothetical protein
MHSRCLSFERTRVLLVLFFPVRCCKSLLERIGSSIINLVLRLEKITCAVLGSMLPPSFGKNSRWPIWKLWLLILERGRRSVLPLLNGLIAGHVCLFLVFFVLHELDPNWKELCLAANLKQAWRAFRCSRSSIFDAILSLRQTCVCSVLHWKEACLAAVHGNKCMSLLLVAIFGE